MYTVLESDDGKDRFKYLVFLIRNIAGATPRHCIALGSVGDKILYVLHSVGAPRCSLDMQGCNAGCEGSSDDYNGVPPPPPLSPVSRDILNQMLSVAGTGVAATR
jgi:calcium-independent phospholipase A2